MAFETWITPEQMPVLAAEAMAVIDARLTRLSEAQRHAYWASIRKAYNTPYNEPVKAPKPLVIVEPIAILLAESALSPNALDEVELPMAVIAAAAIAPEAHAA